MEWYQGLSRKEKLFEWLGWYGAAAIVGAYALVSFKMVPADGWVFQTLNLTGAIGIIIISRVKRVHQSVVLNAFWVLIAVVALIQLALHH